jgi:hypothetical protein
LQRDLLAGRQPTIQLNVDATRMSQAFTGSGYIQSMIAGEVTAFAQRHRTETLPPVDLALRARFNPELNKSWFGAVMEVINNVTMLSIVLTGAALIREREHGTVEHLLVMPVTPFEIMTSKVWAMGLVVLAACMLSPYMSSCRVCWRVPIEGSIALFMAGAGLHLFATTSMGIFMATLARSMPQFGHAADAGAAAPANAVGRRHPARKHAGAGAPGHGNRADHAFRRLLPGDPVSRRRLRRRLAAADQPGRDRVGVVHVLAGAVSQGLGRDGVAIRLRRRGPRQPAPTPSSSVAS